jgi:hypothetical protein
MTARDQLRDVVRILSPLVECRPGIAGMVLVDGVPMLRIAGDRLLLLAVVVGTSRIDARTIGPHEDPARIASDVLARLDTAKAA